MSRPSDDPAMGPNDHEHQVEGQDGRSASTRTRDVSRAPNVDATPAEVIDTVPSAGGPSEVEGLSKGETAPTLRAPGRKKPHWLRIGLVAGVVALVGGLVGASYTPIFAASHLRVRTGDELSRAEILRLAGVDRSTNIVHLDLGEVERRIERSPWVEDARVERSLPSTLRIRIVERRPVAVVDAERLERGDLNGTAIVTEDGTVVPSTPRGGLPIVVPDGGLPSLEASDLRAAADALAPLPRGLRATIDEVRVAPERELVLRIDDLEITFGRPTAVEAKAEALIELVRWAEGKNISLRTIDVQVPGSPAATLTSGSTVVPLGP
jgi:cell division septal protein FtsQ